MEAILDNKGLLPWIKGKKKKPEIQILGDLEKIQAREDEIEEWEKKDRSTCTIIMINLGNDQIVNVTEDNIGKHIKELCKIREELHIMENEIDDQQFRNVIITSLPDSWMTFTDTYFRF
ncbi:uncharacterized protein LAESUDRAFT_755787 [Laetiporus sulphureus 93-53]|uniref:Uncharacterized protein n=1 Tax=Laetiporus sulphureus 93-53 TaxID=1314785 RepID=A0A165GFJ1_9APHY|nr:uncharacterized protein LAESUDRAFT_755787 [Laetiporus sulphureus 93-53]KZT10278.1 hypothetical protein LAESUDRAFT_755787 [Laetiporus sulphureus 93-53]